MLEQPITSRVCRLWNMYSHIDTFSYSLKEDNHQNMSHLLPYMRAVSIVKFYISIAQKNISTSPSKVNINHNLSIEIMGTYRNSGRINRENGRRKIGQMHIYSNINGRMIA